MVKFSAFIKRQKDRDDPSGDFARDFIDTFKNPLWAKRSGVKPLDSETLYGFYKHLPMAAQSDEIIIDVLITLWKEWLKENHIGLRFSSGNKGYVYFFKIPNQTAFKIGRTTQHPEARKRDVQSEAKTELLTFNWLNIENYDVIENELKKAFSPLNYSREWFEIDEMHVNEAILLYQKTDPVSNLFREITDKEKFQARVQDALREES